MDRLHRGRIERQDHHFDPVLVHFAKPHLLHVEQARPQRIPDIAAENF
jgi:hypothetical protein